MAILNYGKCALLLPMDGENNGTIFTNYAPEKRSVTPVGNAKTLTTQSKFYGSSGYFDGTGDYLYTYLNQGIGTSDFTIELWYYRSGDAGSAAQRIVGIGSMIAANEFALYSDTAANGRDIVFYANSADRIRGADFPLNTWAHLAVVRTSGVTKVYVDGVAIATAYADSSDYANALLKIGDSSNTILGYVQDVCIWIGAAIYTTDFTPPVSPLIKEISGITKDITDTPASRIVTAFPRTNPTAAFSTVSSAVDGSYTLRVPDVEVFRVALADEVTLENDLITRIIPG